MFREAAAAPAAAVASMIRAGGCASIGRRRYSRPSKPPSPTSAQPHGPVAPSADARPGPVAARPVARPAYNWSGTKAPSSRIANVKVALLHEAMLNGADEPVAEGAFPLQVYPLQPDVLRLRRRRRRTWLLAESTGHLLQAFLALVPCPGGSDRRLRKGPPS